MSEIERKERTIYESEAIIESNENIVGMGLWYIGNELKAIRDTKTFKQKGYESFEQYAETELKYSRSHIYNFISIAEKYEVQSIGQMGHIGINKLLALGQLEQEEREQFIQQNPVEDMTTRELQQAIKENNALKKQVVELENKPPQVIEKEKIVVPGDYEQVKGKFAKLNYQLQEKELEIKRLEEQLRDSKDGLELKKQIEHLSKQKSDLSRQIQSATELSKLAVRLHDVLKHELAPIKFSRCMEQLDKSETAIGNLVEIIDLVREWLHEIERYLPDRDFDYVEGEVIG